MSKILIVYYSKTGHTAQIARELANLCGADTEAIVSKNDGDKGFKFFRALLNTAFQRSSEIEPSKKSPQDYDLIVVGTPVWMFKLSPFTRAYLKHHSQQFKQVAFFCTQGGNGDKRVFKQMSEESKKQALATLVIDEKELEKHTYQSKLTTFANSLVAKSAAI